MSVNLSAGEEKMEEFNHEERFDKSFREEERRKRGLNNSPSLFSVSLVAGTSNRGRLQGIVGIRF